MTKAREQECNNANKLERVWLLHKQEHNAPCAVRRALYSSSILKKKKKKSMCLSLFIKSPGLRWLQLMYQFICVALTFFHYINH